MITQHAPYNATQRYFRACDILDAAEHGGASPRRIARLKAWVDKLCDEAANDQAEAIVDLRDSVDAMVASLRSAFGGINPSNN